MIRILVADRLNPETIDLLNQIPEFEINEKAGLTPKQLPGEIKNADALIVNGSVPLNEDIFNEGGDLKLVVRSSGVSGPIDAAAAQRHHIEIRTAVGHPAAPPGGKMAEPIAIDVIAILKDFFNV
jgi:phosphoglycerate dehydrogenase-like enzyme